MSRPAPSYQGMPSWQSSGDVAATLIPHLLECLVGGLGSHLVAGVQHPDSVLFSKPGGGPDCTQRQALALRFQLKCVPGIDTQLVPYRLRNDDAPCLIECDGRNHNGIPQW